MHTPSGAYRVVALPMAVDTAMAVLIERALDVGRLWRIQDGVSAHELDRLAKLAADFPRDTPTTKVMADG